MSLRFSMSPQHMSVRMRYDDMFIVYGEITLGNTLISWKYERFKTHFLFSSPFLHLSKAWRKVKLHKNKNPDRWKWNEKRAVSAVRRRNFENIAQDFCVFHFHKLFLSVFNFLEIGKIHERRARFWSLNIINGNFTFVQIKIFHCHHLKISSNSCWTWRNGFKEGSRRH